MSGSSMSTWPAGRHSKRRELIPICESVTELPHQISLQYVMKDRFGKVLAKGADLLIDPNYQWNVTYQGTDELYSERRCSVPGS
jgi:hypothetical protein